MIEQDSSGQITIGSASTFKTSSLTFQLETPFEVPIDCHSILCGLVHGVAGDHCWWKGSHNNCSIGRTPAGQDSGAVTSNPGNTVQIFHYRMVEDQFWAALRPEYLRMGERRWFSPTPCPASQISSQSGSTWGWSEDKRIWHGCEDSLNTFLKSTVLYLISLCA